MSDTIHRQNCSAPVILVVDDDSAARLQMRFCLENEGFVVVEAESGVEALNYFRSSRVDLVLLDVLMPGIDGLLTCREIRNLPDGLNLPVVMITGLDDENTINQAFDAGATDFVMKPVNSLILGYRVRYWLRSGAVLRALETNQARLFKTQEIAGLGHWERNLDSGEFLLTCSRPELFGLGHPCRFDDLFAAIDPADRPAVEAAISASCRDGTPFAVRYHIDLPGRGRRRLLNQGEVACRDSRRPRHLVGILQDITEMG